MAFVVDSPLVGVAPVAVEAPAGLQLAVLSGGVNMPLVQPVPAQLAEAVDDERSISRAGSETGKSALLPEVEQPATPVPVYPRKQARH